MNENYRSTYGYQDGVWVGMHPQNPFREETICTNELPPLLRIESPSATYTRLTGNLHEFAFQLEDGGHASWYIRSVAVRLSKYADDCGDMTEDEWQNVRSLYFLAEAFDEWGLHEDHFWLVIDFLAHFRTSLPENYLEAEMADLKERNEVLANDNDSWKTCSDLTQEEFDEKFAKYVA